MARGPVSLFPIYRYLWQVLKVKEALNSAQVQLAYFWVRTLALRSTVGEADPDWANPLN
jgi:hypothetical protein